MLWKPRLWKTGAAALVAAFLLVPMAVWAGPLEDANARYQAGDYRGALTLLQKAREQEPNNPQIYVGLGKTYRRLGDNNAARDAYSEILKLDPQLRSIKDKAGFLSAYRALGGSIPNTTPTAPTSSAATSSSEIISALSDRGVFIVPGLCGQVDESALLSAVEAAKPITLKIAVLGGVGNYPDRDSLAVDLRQHLNLPETGVLIVATPKGVSASSSALSRAQITEAIQGANYDVTVAQQGATAGIVAVARSVAAQSGDRVAAGGRSTVVMVVFLVLGVGGFLAWRKAAAERQKNDARAPIEPIRQKVLADLSYVDGYLDLLPSGEDAAVAKRLRQEAFEKYDAATGILRVAGTVEEIRQAQPLLEEASRQMDSCKERIDKATGGTGVAMGVLETPSLETTEQKGRRYLRAEEIHTEQERATMQREIDQIPAQQRGVSFFSGQPLPAEDLIPVTVVVQGRKRTVLASREEARAISEGTVPVVRAFRDDTGRYIPWYDYRGYDPYRDYYGNATLLAASDLINLYLITNLMGATVYDNYGPWGYGGYGWGMPAPMGGFSVFDERMPSVEEPAFDLNNTAGTDLFGSTYDEHSSGNFDVPTVPDTGTFDTGSFDTSSSSGGFDVGSSSGSDSGGGGGGSDFGSSGGGDW